MVNVMRQVAAMGMGTCMLMGAVLGGCQTQVRVDVRNMADQPVNAELVWLYYEQTNPAIRQARIAPGDRTSIGPVTVPYGRQVTLVVDFQGNVGHPAELAMQPGRNVVNVRRADEGVAGRIRLEEVPRP